MSVHRRHLASRLLGDNFQVFGFVFTRFPCVSASSLSLASLDTGDNESVRSGKRTPRCARHAALPAGPLPRALRRVRRGHGFSQVLPIRTVRFLLEEINIRV